MTDKEYTYDIDKYTIGVDTNGEDGIGMTVVKIENGQIYFLGNCYGENARCLDLLIKENQELKSQLRGTTHCFDEEEHKKLKEEITNLSKDVDMWNTKYNDMFDENKRLKEALEAKSYCKYANKCDELYDCSREEYEDMANANVRLNVENYDLKEENKELKKQLENKYEKVGTLTGELLYEENTKLINQQKEFIKCLEGNMRFAPEPRKGLLKDILNKYKEIIGE